MQMNILLFASSEALFHCSEPLARPEIAEFRSLSGRRSVLIYFLKALLLIPLAGLYKLYRTALTICGVLFSIAALALTLCTSLASREFFLNKMAQLAKELADWMLWPIGVVFCLGRLLLAVSVHPAFYFHLNGRPSPEGRA